MAHIRYGARTPEQLENREVKATSVGAYVPQRVYDTVGAHDISERIGLASKSDDVDQLTAILKDPRNQGMIQALREIVSGAGPALEIDTSSENELIDNVATLSSSYATTPQASRRPTATCPSPPA